MRRLPSHTTIQRQFEAEMVPGSAGLTVRPRPHLMSKWTVADDGTLMCRWTR